MKLPIIAGLISGLLMTTVGCSSSTTREVQSVTMTYLNPFPSGSDGNEKTFTLSEEQLAEFTQLCPDLNQADGPSCSSVAPPFWFDVTYSDGQKVSAQFCCGRLRTYDPDGHLDAPEGLREFLIQAINQQEGSLNWD